MFFEHDPVGSRFMPPTTTADANAAKPPAQVTSLPPSAPPLSLADELRQALARRAELEAQDAALRKELQELATRRDELERRAAEVERDLAARQDGLVDQLLKGSDPAKKAPLTELAALGQAISQAREVVARRSAETEVKLVQLDMRRHEHETTTLADIKWRIALGRYAKHVKDLIPLARELGSLSRVQRRSFMWGAGLVIDPRSEDIAGVPLSLALSCAQSLGDADEVLQ